MKRTEQTAALQQKHLKAPRQKRQRSGPLMIYAAHGWTYANNKPVLHYYEVLAYCDATWQVI